MKMNAKALADLVTDVAGKVFTEKSAEMREQLAANKAAAAEQEANNAPGFEAAAKGELQGATNPEDFGMNAVKFMMSLFQAGDDPKKALELAHRRKDKNMTLAFEKSISMKALETSPLANGGALIPQEFSKEIIEFLRNKSVVLKSGARQVNMPNGSLTISKQSGTAALSYLGEGDNYTASQPSFGDIVLNAKKAGGIVPISEELLSDSSFDTAQLVRDDLLGALATLNDVTMLRSAGGENKPRGLRYQVASANVLTQSKLGTVATIAEKTYDLARLLQLVYDSNVPGTRNGWVMSNRDYVHLSTLRNSNNGFAFPELQKGMLLNHPVLFTGNVPTNLGAGTESEIYFGDWSQMVIGETGGIKLTTLPGAAYHDGTSVVSSFSKDQVPVKVRLRNDMKLRHDTGFGVLTGVTWGGVAPV